MEFVCLLFCDSSVVNNIYFSLVLLFTVIVCFTNEMYDLTMMGTVDVTSEVY
jgi:hypothetical protein